MILLPRIALDLSGNDYLLPYFQRQFPQATKEPEPPVAGIKIFTNDAEAQPEDAFEDYCSVHELPVASIWCPAIVCTGMKGLPMRIASGINKGSYVRIRGNNSRISVVHGTDVARASTFALGSQGSYVLTDCTDPKIDALADALAYRLGDKRIISLKPWAAKIWLGSKFYEQLTTSHTAPCSFVEVFPAFSPTPVVDYLRTHVYDEESL